jgi:hypothetical protein
MRHIRFDPLDDQRAVLLMGRNNSIRSVDCTLRWLQRHTHALRFENLFTGNLGQ